MEAQERNFAWVARHSGLSPATVARLLRAERAMSVEQFVDMAGALGIEPSKAINQALAPGAERNPAASFTARGAIRGRSHGRLSAAEMPYRQRAAQSGESVGRAMRARQDEDAELSSRRRRRRPRRWSRRLR